MSNKNREMRARKGSRATITKRSAGNGETAWFSAAFLMTAMFVYLLKPAKPLPGTGAAKKGKPTYEFVVFDGEDEKTRVISHIRATYLV